MDDAGLEDRRGEGSLHGVRKPLEAVGANDENVLHAPLPDLGKNGEPKLGAFGGREPHAEDTLGAIGLHAHSEVDALVGHRALVADFDDQGVQINREVYGLERPRLPSAHLVHHCLGDVADELRADVDAVNFLDVRLDVPGAHAPRIHGQNFLVEALHAPFMLLDEPRLEAPLPVARDGGFHSAQLPAKGLRPITIATVLLPVRRLLPLLVPQVGGHLGFHRPVHDRADQLF